MTFTPKIPVHTCEWWLVSRSEANHLQKLFFKVHDDHDYVDNNFGDFQCKFHLKPFNDLLWFRQLIVYGYKSRETVPEVQMPQHRIEVRFTRIHSIDNADGVQCYSPLYFAVTTPTGIRFEVV